MEIVVLRLPEENTKDLSRTIASNLRILLFSFAVSFTVLATSLLIQWFVYYDWLHQTGPLRITGTFLATVLTFAFVLRSQLTVRDRQRRMLLRFETIARMNDRVRNALQTIECVTYLSGPEATQPVREAVEVIDDVLQDVLEDVSWFDARKANSTYSCRSATMKQIYTAICLALSLAALRSIALAQTLSGPAVPVTIDNYNRAQSDVYFALIAKGGGFGRFRHGRDLAPIGPGGIIRPNRDTLYSLAVFDLDAGPVTITLPEPYKHFMTMQVINEDQYTQPVYYGAGSHTLTREMIGTRYAGVAVRVLVDPRNKNELQQIHSFQDAIKVTQQNPGTFQIPNWDEASRKKLQATLLQLGTTISDTRRMYGANENQVDPIKHLIGSAMLWGGAPEKDALYLPTTPDRDDGTTIYRLRVKDVPVGGFWSLTVYNSEGYIEPNKYGAYSVNRYTAIKGPDGSVVIQFGGCDGKIPNCLPITNGWNYTVRLFRPRPEILDGRWKFPLALPEN